MAVRQKYVMRKYVMASSAMDAIRQDKKTPVQDVWVSEKQEEYEEKTPCIGFMAEGGE